MQLLSRCKFLASKLHRNNSNSHEKIPLRNDQTKGLTFTKWPYKLSTFNREIFLIKNENKQYFANTACIKIPQLYHYYCVLS